MEKLLKGIAFLLELLVVVFSRPAWQLYDKVRKVRSEDPLVWEEEIIRQRLLDEIGVPGPAL